MHPLPMPEEGDPLAVGSGASFVEVTWTDRDTVRDLTIVTVVAYGIAAALAIFGLPPVSLHGPLHFVGVMDPLCGMTRAVRLLALGDIDEAVRYNPASPLLALVTLGILARAVIGTCTGRWLVLHVRRSRALIAASTVLIAALWINQQAQASRLM